MRRVLPKLLALLAVFVVLWGLLLAVRDVLHDRQNYRSEAVASIAQGTAGEQALMGPLIVRRCTQRWVELDDRKKPSPQEVDSRIWVAPQSLSLPNAQVTLTPLKRGLFSANTFALKADLHAAFGATGMQPEGVRPGASVSCDAPMLLLAVSDARGIRAAQVRINGQTADVGAGTGLSQMSRGIQVDLGPWLKDKNLPPLQVQVALELVGTQSLALAPVAADTQVSLSGNWPHPAFGGQFLPVERQVSERGFSATWRVSALATSAFDQVSDGKKLCQAHGAEWSMVERIHQDCAEAFHVRFIDPVDPYTLSDRASKYGLLFVVLTFVAVGLIEVLRRLRVHPVQYALVGCALSVFFLLLLSLSEHLPFATAYALAAAGCVLLLTYYARHVLQSWRLGLPFGAGVALLYGLLYVLLQLEQNALLVGSLALFAVLALLMWATRRVDWYALTGQTAKAAPARAVAEPPQPPGA